MTPARDHSQARARSSPTTAGKREFQSGAVDRELSYVLQAFRRLGVRSPELDALAQEVLSALRDGGTQPEQRPPLRPYLFGIAFQVMSRHHQERLREILGREDTRAPIASALGAIPLPRRTVLIMHDLEEVPLDDVARVFRVPLVTVYARLTRARRELEVALRRIMLGEA